MEVNVYGEVHVHTNKELDLGVGKGSPEMALIKRAVKKRDNHTCQVCGEKDKILEVHHIFPQSKYPQLSGDTGNLITICQSCHTKYHQKFEGSESAVSFVKYLLEE